jgi:hypothetical protein
MEEPTLPPTVSLWIPGLLVVICLVGLGLISGVMLAP